MEELEKLIDEVQQIKIQYKAEVKGGHKEWPQAVRDRIVKIRSLDLLTIREISERT